MRGRPCSSEFIALCDRKRTPEYPPVLAEASKTHAGTPLPVSVTAIDLFSGCGGMTTGLEQAGFRVVVAVEMDSVAASTFRLNHEDTALREADIRSVDPVSLMQDLGLVPGSLDLLAGCPPCQGFSRLRTMNGARRNRDHRNRLVMEMARFVSALEPKSVMMENVPSLATKSVFVEFVRFLRRTGYVPQWDVLDASAFGVPQRRKRLVLLAGRGFRIPFGEPTRETVSVRKAIGGMPTPGSSGDYLHDMPERRTPQMRAWIAAVPRDGGSRLDLPEHVQRECHKRTTGFKDVYGRMAWDEPAPTITGGCFNPSKGRFLHPQQDRNITMREAALLQSFPPSFCVPDGTPKTAVAQMVGNALPPEFVRRQAVAILAHLKVQRSGNWGLAK